MQSFRVRGTSVRLNVHAKALVSRPTGSVAKNSGGDVPAGDPPKLLFRQLFEKDSCTFTYLLADVGHPDRPALLVDPVDKMVDRDVNLINELGLKLTFAMNTHVHADHITGTARLKAKFPDLKSVISEASKAKADILVCPNDKIYIGNIFLEVRATPGHTQGCVTYVTGEGPNQPHPRMAFTGDALLIRGCGRTDFQGGNARQLYKSIHSQILTLPKETLLYPAHDYKGLTATTVEEELLYNPRLTKDEDTFKDIMKSGFFHCQWIQTESAAGCKKYLGKLVPSRFEPMQSFGVKGTSAYLNVHTKVLVSCLTGLGAKNSGANMPITMTTEITFPSDIRVGFPPLHVLAG